MSEVDKTLQPLNAFPTLMNVDAVSDAEQLLKLSARETTPQDVPLASEIVSHVPVYSGDKVRTLSVQANNDAAAVHALQLEWAEVLLNGAGALVIRQAVNDTAMLDDVTAVFQQIMEDESGEQVAADHFAAAGSNTRIWNSHEKLCMHAPELFARYYSNDAMSLVCRAWLGPGYQITAQANVVHPSGRAQVCHRDYHLGFQSSDILGQYPSHVHGMSPLLTLQGGIAHTGVPVDSGPTQLLPFSQKLLGGYISVEHEEVRDHFLKHFVQLALDKGDMLFFNPALFHAAGDNNTEDMHRFVNLFQVGSAYGRTLEIVDRARMSVQLYPVLQAMLKRDELSQRALIQVIEACAEGYAFPASMDLEPPVGGLAPASQQAVMLKSLEDGLPAAQFVENVQSHLGLKRSF